MQHNKIYMPVIINFNLWRWRFWAVIWWWQNTVLRCHYCNPRQKRRIRESSYIAFIRTTVASSLWKWEARTQTDFYIISIPTFWEQAWSIYCNTNRIVIDSVTPTPKITANWKKYTHFQNHSRWVFLLLTSFFSSTHQWVHGSPSNSWTNNCLFCAADLPCAAEISGHAQSADLNSTVIKTRLIVSC